MTDSAPARLVGGPFDGDEGLMFLPLPDKVWACGCQDDDCEIPGKVHWFKKRPEEPDEEVYVKGQDRLGVRLYVWAGLELDPTGGMSVHDLVTA